MYIDIYHDLYNIVVFLVFFSFIWYKFNVYEKGKMYNHGHFGMYFFGPNKAPSNDLCLPGGSF